MEQKLIIPKEEKDFDFKLLQANWHIYLEACKIKVCPKIVYHDGLLLLTKCSGKKFDVARGTPKQIYDSDETQRFIKYCEKRKYNYAILSAHYGLVYGDEVIENYEANVYGNKMSNEKVRTLASIIVEKIKVNTLMYWAPSPLMSYPYLRILFEAKKLNPEINLRYTTQLGTDEQVTMDKWFN